MLAQTSPSRSAPSLTQISGHIQSHFPLSLSLYNTNLTLAALSSQLSFNPPPSFLPSISTFSPSSSSPSSFSFLSVEVVAVAVVVVMSEKDCGKHGHKRKRLFRCLFATFLSFIILVLFVIFVIWIVLRPTKPKFALQEASVFQFNLTGSNLLTTSLQISLLTRNPNDRIGIYYDRMDVYASYRNQQVTLATSLPRTYLGHNEINIWSPYLNGVLVPVSPYLSVAVSQDQMVGYYVLNVKVDGRVRWKVGTWISGHYHIYVNCPAYLRMDSRSVNGANIRLQQPVGCHVDV